MGGTGEIVRHSIDIFKAWALLFVRQGFSLRMLQIARRTSGRLNSPWNGVELLHVILFFDTREEWRDQEELSWAGARPSWVERGAP
jgi:hypothetical protein